MNPTSVDVTTAIRSVLTKAKNGDDLTIVVSAPPPTRRLSSASKHFDPHRLLNVRFTGEPAWLARLCRRNARCPTVLCRKRKRASTPAFTAASVQSCPTYLRSRMRTTVRAGESSSCARCSKGPRAQRGGRTLAQCGMSRLWTVCPSGVPYDTCSRQRATLAGHRQSAIARLSSRCSSAMAVASGARGWRVLRALGIAQFFGAARPPGFAMAMLSSTRRTCRSVARRRDRQEARHVHYSQDA
jgi:hypothetical protein